MSPAAEEVLARALELPQEECEQFVLGLLRSIAKEPDLAPEERARLEAAIARAEEQFKAGQGVDAGRLLEELEQIARSKGRAR